MKIICFGVRDYEIEIFKKIEKEFNYVFELSELYINDSNYHIAYGYDVIIIRANCNLSYGSLEDLKKHNLKFLLTRTIGYNHIDLDTCRKLGIKVAYAPGYSPSSIAELGLGLALNLIRNIPESMSNSKKCDFTLNKNMFGRVINGSTVGIIGCGIIGKKSAMLYKSLGATVLAYDIIKDETINDIITYVSLEQLLRESDIISIHASYSKNTNYHMISSNEIEKMKNNVIIINTSRGELIDTNALIEGIKNGKIYGAGLDVIENENKYFFKNCLLDDDDRIKQLVELFPRVIVTPHISSSTDKAVYDALMITMNNLDELIRTNKCKNILV